MAYAAAEGHPRELLVAVRFQDGRGELIPPPYLGFSSSDAFPGYCYLPTRLGDGYTSLPIPSVESAQSIQVTLYPWRRTNITCDTLEVPVVGPTLASQRRQLVGAVRRFRASVSDGDAPPVLIRAMAALGHGFSRPACLAEAFRKLGYPVVWVGSAAVEEGASLPSSDDIGLLKLPDACLAGFLDDLLLALPPGLFLQSACDQSGIHLQSVLRAAGWRCVQEVHDDWEARPIQGLAPGHSTIFERQLCEGSDLVVAGTDMLARRICDLSGGIPVQMIPNGTWAADLPEGVADPAGPVGYFGSLAETDFDWPLLRCLATRWPDLSFELYGTGMPATLDRPDNVRVIDAHCVPGTRETASWRGALLLLSPVLPLAGVSPIQLQEYQARGLPTLANAQCDIDAGPGMALYEDEVDAARRMDGWLETARGASPSCRQPVAGWQDTARAFLEALS